MRVFVVVHASVAAIEIMNLSINLKWTNGIILLHFVRRENIVPQWAFKLNSSLAAVEGLDLKGQVLKVKLILLVVVIGSSCHSLQLCLI
jgi:hypothetical protein